MVRPWIDAELVGDEHERGWELLMSCMSRMTLIVSGTVSGWRSEAQRTSASGEGSMPMRSLALTTPITFSSVPSQTGKLLCGMSCTRFMFSSKLRRELSQAISLLAS